MCPSGTVGSKRPLHPSTAQSNNRAGLQAVIVVLEHSKSCDLNLVVVMDCQYMYDGLKRSAFRRRASGWVGQSGLVCNADLWVVLLDLVDSITPTVRWLRVTSHTDIPGNERADRLAEEGRVGSPFYHSLSLRERPVIDMDLPFTPTPRHAPAVFRSLDMAGIITPLHNTPAFHRTNQSTENCHDPSDALPKCLDFWEPTSPPSTPVLTREALCAHSSLRHGQESEGLPSSGDTATTVSYACSINSQDLDEV